MNIELTKRDRIAFPMGIMDFDIDFESQLVYAACMDGIYRCSVAPRSDEGKPTPTKVGSHSSYVSGIAIGRLARSLVSTSYDGTLHIRELPATDSQQGSEDELQPRIAKRIHDFWSWDMCLSPDERFIASVTGQYLAGAEDYSPLASQEACVKVLDLKTGETLHAMEMLPSVQCVAIDPSSRYVAAANLMGDVGVWDIESGRSLAQWRTPSFTSWGIIKSHCYIGGIYAISFSQDGEFVYVAGMGEMGDPMAGNGKQRWQRFAWRSSPVEKQLESNKEQMGEGLMETLAWHPAGEYFAMAGRLRGGNWNVGLFAAQSGELIGQAKTGMRITSARFDPDGKHLYLAGMQGQPKPKEGNFPNFGYFERYELTVK